MEFTDGSKCKLDKQVHVTMTLRELIIMTEILSATGVEDEEDIFVRSAALYGAPIAEDLIRHSRNEYTLGMYEEMSDYVEKELGV